MNKRISSAAVTAAAWLFSAGCDAVVKELSSARPPANEASGAEVAPATPLATNPAAVEQDKAIALAKEARTLVAGRMYAKLPPAETLTNDFQIRTEMSKVKGDINIVGWQAQKWTGDTYLVTYTWERDGLSRGWPFEVKVSAGIVRFIIGDPELEGKYGWGTS
ncbi:MAG TPA: hypothetical protein VMS12_05545 [Thermoanaerobaculia bacterium]|nr:hypothetical protein [Thermoanaerobaculia bacterium]